MASRVRTARVTLANLHPAKGAQHLVSRTTAHHVSALGELTRVFFSSKNESVEVKGRVTVEQQVVVQMVKNLVLVPA